MVSTDLDFADRVWITTAGKEFGCIGLAGGGYLSDDVTGIVGEVLLDETVFRMVEVEHSVDPLSLGLYLDFDQCQEVTMGCLKVNLKGKVQIILNNNSTFTPLFSFLMYLKMS